MDMTYLFNINNHTDIVVIECLEQILLTPISSKGNWDFTNFRPLLFHAFTQPFRKLKYSLKHHQLYLNQEAENQTFY